MKNIILIVTLSLCTYVFSGTGHNHGGHSHGGGDVHSHAPKLMTKEKSGEIARKQVERLVKEEKIDASWKKSIMEKSVKKTFKKKKEWLVTFTNVEGKKGKKLFIFLSLNGTFVAANFTGK